MAATFAKYNILDGSAAHFASDLNVIHVVGGLYQAHGGTTYSVPRLCQVLAAAGVKVSLLSVSASGELTSAVKDGYDDLRFPQDCSRIPVLRGLRQSSRLSTTLKKAAPHASVIHNHGVWLAPNLAAGRAAHRAGKPLIVSPRGMLSPAALRFSPWKKRLIWYLGQGRVIHKAHCLHATSELEYQELRALGLQNPIAIIPNGVDLPKMELRRDREQRTLLFLGRMHPKKGLDRLLRAWAEIERNFGEWRLRIVGPPEGGYDGVLNSLIIELGIRRASLEGALYGDARLAAYHGADLFVLPSLSENFGLTVAEALAAGIPVIATKGTPWSGLVDQRCGWWTDHDVGALAVALAAAMGASATTRAEMGVRGRAWMAAEFSWERVGFEMAALYSWLACKSDVPPSVRFH